MLPLALMFPELLQNELRTGWAVRQGSDGMILEFLGDFSAPGGRLTGQMDISAGGRVMGDVTTVFILATLAVVLDDSNGTVPSFAVEMWPSIVRAARWQINRAHALGCPNNLQTTYDYLGLDSKAIATYNAFLHNAAMRAVVELAARVRDNSTLSHDARASEAACSAVINSTLWRINGTDGGWWRAWQDANGSGAPDYILSGALHGQSWASVLGLGFLAPVERIAAHVAAETALNCDYKPAGCPLGLLTLRQPGTTWSEDASPSQSMDATVARLISGAGGLTGSPAEAVVQLYRETHHDLWHWMDLHVGPAGLDCAGADISGAGLAGQPFVNRCDRLRTRDDVVQYNASSKRAHWPPTSTSQSLRSATARVGCLSVVDRAALQRWAPHVLADLRGSQTYSLRECIAAVVVYGVPHYAIHHTRCCGHRDADVGGWTKRQRQHAESNLHAATAVR